MIGTAPQTASKPEEPGHVVCGQFDVASTRPLRGGVAIDDFMAELETDANMVPRLESARRALADILDKTNTIRRLRLAAGLSQAKLAARAKTTQPYIARIEAGTLDPGTDMLARLASALGSDELTVFSAIRAQRTGLELPRVG